MSKDVQAVMPVLFHRFAVPCPRITWHAASVDYVSTILMQGISSAAITGQKGIQAQLAYCINCKVRMSGPMCLA